eukprot:gene19602-26285_t
MTIEDIQYLQTHSRREDFVMFIDSSTRDKLAHPSPNHSTITFDEPFKNVYGVDILDLLIPRTQYNIDTGNNLLCIGVGPGMTDANNRAIANVPPQNYSVDDLAESTRMKDDQNAQTALIMEDDLKVIPPEKFGAFKANMERVFATTPDDWQFINLSPCWTWCEVRKPVANDGLVYDSNSSKSSHFYVLTKQAAATIYQHALPIFNIPYDVKINILSRQGLLRMYESGFQIAEQDRGTVHTMLGHYDDMPVCNTNIVKPRNRFLVFTSAGDQSQWYKHWMCSERRYDVTVMYYGDGSKRSRHEKHADNFKQMKGGKLQNLYAWYHSNPEVMDGYDFVAVWDDDIQIECLEINKLFATAENLNLWICQPCFTDDS